MKKLKVLIIASKYPRFKGDPQPPFTYYLARNLTNKNCSVQVIAPHAPNIKTHDKFDDIAVHRFKYFFPTKFERLAYGPGIPANIRTSFLAKIQIPFFLLSEIFFARKLIKQINPDIIHVHWAIPQGIAALFLGKPFIMTVYGGEVFLSKNFHMISLFNYLIKKSKVTFAITNGLKKIMQEFGIKGNGKLKVIPLGVDIEQFRPNISGWKDIKKKYCKENELMVLCVGRLVEKKGIHFLLPAFAKVLEKLPNCKLVLVGDGYMYDSLITLSKKLKLNDKVFFAKEINHQELPKYYCAADLFVLPSIIDKTGNRETQGVVYLEAMACKVPVIGTNTGGIPDVISNNKVGVLVPEKNVEKLSEQMIRLLKSSDLRKGYAENAYKHVIDNFVWSNIADKYIKEYKRCIKVN